MTISKEYNRAVVNRVRCALIPDSEKVRILGNLCEYWYGHIRFWFSEENYDYFCKKLNDLERKYSENAKGTPEVYS